MRILLCTDGSPHGQSALRFGASLAQGSPEPATLLGVIERTEDRARVERALREGKDWLEDAPEPWIKLREGKPSKQILEETASGEYDMLVVGTRGRRGITRVLLGSTAERITGHSIVPVLLVQGEHEAVRRILVCTAGGEPGLVAIGLAGRVAQLAGAQVTVLHVMSQLPASPVLPYADALKIMPQTPAPSEVQDAQILDLRASAEELMQGSTREGAHLREALAILADLDVPAQARVRHGLVIDEILDETCQEDYNLVVVGSQPSGSWMRFLLDDVSQHIIDCTDRPVLVARFRSDQKMNPTMSQDTASVSVEKST
jgi:nucleotide-binding universal stress UspA family protein